MRSLSKAEPRRRLESQRLSAAEAPTTATAGADGQRESQAIAHDAQRRHLAGDGDPAHGDEGPQPHPAAAGQGRYGGRIEGHGAIGRPGR